MPAQTEVETATPSPESAPSSHPVDGSARSADLDTGYMNWLSSPSPEVDGAALWKYELDEVRYWGDTGSSRHANECSADRSFEHWC
jgi:hypothetical protein